MSTALFTREMNPVELALQSLGCTQSELARRLGVGRAVVHAWKVREAIPVREVRRVSEVSGVPAHLLCPKFFPKPVEVPAPSQQ